MSFSVGRDDFESGKLLTLDSPALICLMPSIEQISTQELLVPVAAAIAWEIDGARAANKIAKHAIQAAICRVVFFIPIGEFYHPSMGAPILKASINR